MKKIMLLTIATLSLLTACESMEDTYKEYAGDGPIRYPGRCTDVTVSPGWECLRVAWTLSNDPAVKNIVVTCASENDTLVTELEPTATSCQIDNLEDINYVVKVQSKADDGSMSLAEGVTERPYSYEHEAVKAFTLGFSRAYLGNGHLLLMMSIWDEGIERFWLTYTKLDGTEGSTELTKEMSGQKMVDIDNINTSKPIVLNRIATLQGCPDVINFQPVDITRSVVFSSDFKKNMNERYGLNNNAQTQFADDMKELEIDFDLMTMQDLLNFTNLKKVILGKNHYFYGSNFKPATVEYGDESKWVMEKMHDIYGTTFEIYGNSYFDESLVADYIVRKPYSSLPEIDCLSTQGWTISNVVDDPQNDYLVNLLDNDPNTVWSSWPSTEGVRTMEITIDMKSEKEVNGVKIMQSPNTETSNFQPSSIKVMYSTEQSGNWNDLSYVEDNTLGNTLGETTIIKAANKVKARYLKLVVSELVYKGQVKVSLADVCVF
ncbi:MAG: discoidin domain-containing protein [Prevotella sp.]|nr:discoidin domain-containing protein [Prevotella sp.]